MLPTTHASPRIKQKVSGKKIGSNKRKPRINLDFAQRFKKSFKKPKRAPAALHRCEKSNTILASRKCDEKNSTQGDNLSLLPFTFTRKAPNYCKRSLKSRQRMMPLSTFIISPKEYCKLSVLTPVALEREERYNWGHLKKHARVRNEIMRKKERVLQMSSQARAPLEELERREVRSVNLTTFKP